MKRLHRVAMCFYFLIRIIYNCQIHPSAMIRKPAHFGHGMGIVVGDGVIMGSKINLTHNTTIASNTVIGNNFFMGPGSIIVEPVVIGDNVQIGANAIVTHDVPSKSKVLGEKGKIYAMS